MATAESVLRIEYFIFSMYIMKQSYLRKSVQLSFMHTDTHKPTRNKKRKVVWAFSPPLFCSLKKLIQDTPKKKERKKISLTDTAYLTTDYLNILFKHLSTKNHVSTLQYNLNQQFQESTGDSSTSKWKVTNLTISRGQHIMIYAERNSLRVLF